MMKRERPENGRRSACEAVRRRLDDYLDDLLGEARAAEVEAHLEACAACRAEGESLARVLAAVEALPAGLEPPRDLWPEIAARLPERERARAGLAARFWPRAAVAVLLVGLGVLLAPLFDRDVSDRGRTAPAGTEAPAAEPVPAAASSEEFQLVEADFLRARGELRRLAERESGDLSPATRKVIERNLRIIDEAIAEVRRALAEDPGDAELRRQLLAHHRRGIDLLRRLAGAGGGLA